MVEKRLTSWKALNILADGKIMIKMGAERRNTENTWTRTARHLRLPVRDHYASRGLLLIQNKQASHKTQTDRWENLWNITFI